MAKYMLRRLVELVITVFLIATATFFLLEAVPGDALSERADKLPVESRTALYERYGLDKSMMERSGAISASPLSMPGRPSPGSSATACPSPPAWASSRCCWACRWGCC